MTRMRASTLTHFLRPCVAYTTISKYHSQYLMRVVSANTGIPDTLSSCCLPQVQPYRSLRDSKDGEFRVVYTAPLKGAVKAVKVFSLTTAVLALLGSPILVWMGNPSVPVAGRIAISTVVVLAGVSTTALLHWLVKGYIMQLHYNDKSQMAAAYTLSVLGRQRRNEFHISDARPPTSMTGFSTFQAKSKSYFMHTEVFEDKKLLSALLGAYDVFESES